MLFWMPFFGGAVTNADQSFLQSPFRSGITIEDYQLDPLVRAIEMARVNLLIADECRSGKNNRSGFGGSRVVGAS